MFNVNPKLGRQIVSSMLTIYKSPTEQTDAQTERRINNGWDRESGRLDITSLQGVEGGRG